MVPHHHRASDILDLKGPVALAVALERAAARLETAAFYLFLSVLWGLVLFAALTQVL